MDKSGVAATYRSLTIKGSSVNARYPFATRSLAIASRFHEIVLYQDCFVSS
jgi:hypothetical protein